MAGSEPISASNPHQVSEPGNKRNPLQVSESVKKETHVKIVNQKMDKSKEFNESIIQRNP
jgi:hypothetical protein